MHHARRLLLVLRRYYCEKKPMLVLCSDLGTVRYCGKWVLWSGGVSIGATELSRTDDVFLARYCAGFKFSSDLLDRNDEP